MKKAAKLVKPWTAYSSADATQANFPCLLHFFPYEDGGGTYGIRDSVGGIVYPSLELVAANDYSVYGNWTDTRGHNKFLAEGDWANFGTKTLITFGVMIGGASSGGAYWIGDSPSEIEMSAIANWPAWSCTYNGVGAGGNLAIAPYIGSIGTTTPSAVGGVYRPGQKLYGYITDSTGAFVQGAEGETNLPSVWHDFPAKSSVDGVNYTTAYYGFAVFGFESGVPADLAEAVEWMRAEWARGRKAIYPGWAGKS